MTPDDSNEPSDRPDLRTPITALEANTTPLWAPYLNGAFATPICGPDRHTPAFGHTNTKPAYPASPLWVNWAQGGRILPCPRVMPSSPGT